MTTLGHAVADAGDVELGIGEEDVDQSDAKALRAGVFDESSVFVGRENRLDAHGLMSVHGRIQPSLDPPYRLEVGVRIERQALVIGYSLGERVRIDEPDAAGRASIVTRS